MLGILKVKISLLRQRRRHGNLYKGKEQLRQAHEKPLRKRRGRESGSRSLTFEHLPVVPGTLVVSSLKSQAIGDRTVAKERSTESREKQN